MPAVSDIVIPALKAIGVIAYGDPVGAAEAAEAVSGLNSLMASLSMESLNPGTFEASAPANGNTGFLTIGTDYAVTPNVAGDIPIRPAQMTQVFVQNGNLSWELPVLPYAQFQEIRVRSVFSIPRMAYWKPGFPFDELHFFPQLPSGYSVRILGVPYMYGGYKTIADAVYLPAEWIEPLKWELARRLGPIFGFPVPEDVRTFADRSFRAIQSKLVHARQREQSAEVSGIRGWNWLQGWGS